MPPFGRPARAQTSIEDAEQTENGPVYLIKRPRFAESHKSASNSILLSASHTTTRSEEDGSISRCTSNQPQETLTNPFAEKRRFELFIDLLWAGIIGNISYSFAAEAFDPKYGVEIGRAVLNSIVLSLIAWRLWNFLQDFMGKYATNDMVERAFVFWYLVLALLFGTNAPYLFSAKDDQDNICIAIYLIAKGSLLALESVYAIFIPVLRRHVLVRGMFAIPLTAIWIPTFFVPYATRIGLCFAGVVLEFAATSFMNTPWAARFLKEDGTLPNDPDHWVERIRDFFIIILGEGVIYFVRGSPLGRGLNNHAAIGIAALAIFYVLLNLYFNGDQSRNYVHAVKRTWWRSHLWQTAHVIIFHSTLILGVSIIFLIENPNIPGRLPSSPTSDIEDLVNKAKWVSSNSLAITVAAMTVLALLSRPLDKPGTMKIDNRYIRLAPRVALIVVACVLPLRTQMTGGLMLGILWPICYVCYFWEWFGALDKKGGLIG